MSNARSSSTTQVAAAAAEAVRELNHRTQGPTTLTGPAELDRLVAELAVMTAGLPQLLRQLGGWLHTEHDAGRVRSDNHINPGRLVDQAAADLADAGHCARELGRALDAAHQHTAHLGARPADQRTGAPGGIDRAGAVATAGQLHGHQRAGLVSARGQIPMSLDTTCDEDRPVGGRRSTH